MNVCTVSFFGHRQLSNSLELESRLEGLICKLLREKEYVEFLVGRNGEFDQLVASVVRRCKRNYRNDNSALVCVLPYSTAEFRYNEEAFRNYYDEIEVGSGQAFYKSAYQIRNRSMVDRSDLVVFCIQHESGGAWLTMKYANRTGKKHINVADGC